MQSTRKFRWQRWLLILALATSLALIGIFSIRTVRTAPQVRADERIRPWMNVPYIAHSFHVPGHILYQALGFPAGHVDRRPIVDIARAQQRPVQAVIAVLEEAISRYRLATPTPSTPTPTVGGPAP